MTKDDDQGVFVRPGTVIPEHEIHTEPLRGGGPGGQNVNKVSSGVLLRFDVAASVALSTTQKELVMQRLKSRLTRQGELLLRAVEHREHARNLSAARERLAAILAAALEIARVRRPTRPTRGSNRRRLTDKRQNSERKAGRRSRGVSGD